MKIYIVYIVEATLVCKWSECCGRSRWYVALDTRQEAASALGGSENGRADIKRLRSPLSSDCQVGWRLAVPLAKYDFDRLAVCTLAQSGA